jgi:hypothetical protein
VPAPDGGTQYVCVGWTLTGHEPGGGGGTNFEMTVTNDAILTWRWATNYWLETSAEAHGSVAPDSSWQPGGLPALIVATPAAYYHFAHWTNRLGTTIPLPCSWTCPVARANRETSRIRRARMVARRPRRTKDFGCAAQLVFAPDGCLVAGIRRDTDPRDTNSSCDHQVVAGKRSVVSGRPHGRAYLVHFWTACRKLWITQQLAAGIGVGTDTNLPPARRLYASRRCVLKCTPRAVQSFCCTTVRISGFAGSISSRQCTAPESAPTAFRDGTMGCRSAWRLDSKASGAPSPGSLLARSRADS